MAVSSHCARSLSLSLSLSLSVSLSLSLPTAAGDSLSDDDEEDTGATIQKPRDPDAVPGFGAPPDEANDNDSAAGPMAALASNAGAGARINGARRRFATRARGAARGGYSILSG